MRIMAERWRANADEARGLIMVDGDAEWWQTRQCANAECRPNMWAAQRKRASLPAKTPEMAKIMACAANQPI